MRKYRNKKITIDKIKFDSIAEGEYYLYLKKQNLRFELQPKIYMTRARILYKPDFKVYEGDSFYYVDVKGMKTPVFNLKARLWKHYGDGVLKLVKKNGREFFIEKILEVL